MGGRGKGGSAQQWSIAHIIAGVVALKLAKIGVTKYIDSRRVNLTPWKKKINELKASQEVHSPRRRRTKATKLVNNIMTATQNGRIRKRDAIKLLKQIERIMRLT